MKLNKSVQKGLLVCEKALSNYTKVNSCVTTYGFIWILIYWLVQIYDFHFFFYKRFASHPWFTVFLNFAQHNVLKYLCTTKVHSLSI